MKKATCTAIAIAIAAFAMSAQAASAEPDEGASNDFYHEVGEGLKAAVERPDLEVANEAMREQDAREEQARAEAQQAARDAEQAAQDRYQREEYERRNADPQGPF